MEENKEKYGLATAIAMIVGIVIGSGIFFKSDDILKFANGDLTKGVLLFVLAAFSIVFGGMTMAVLANKCKQDGGVINYADRFLGRKYACIFGWFQTFVYYPCLVDVVAWVSGIYICMLFGIEGTFNVVMGIGFTVLTILFIFNTIAPKISGYLQVSSTIIKLVPLIAIGVLGLLFGDVSGSFAYKATGAVASTAGGFGWLAGLAPVAFAYDGWIVSTSIASEIRESEKNLTKALIFSPIFVLIIYVVYFIGITSLIGVENVIALGDAHFTMLTTNVLGEVGTRIVMVFIVISILGTVNGVTIGVIRNPYELSKKNLLPLSKKVNKWNNKLGISVNSAIYGYVLCAFWYAVHYFTQKYNLLPGSDISEISIVTSYLCYIALYIPVLKMSKELSFFRGKVAPVLAILGSLFIFFGSMQNKLFWIYFAMSIALMAVAYAYYKVKATHIDGK